MLAMGKKGERVSAALFRAMQELFDKEYPSEHVAVLDLKVVGHNESANVLWQDVVRWFPDKPVILIPPKGTRPQHLPSGFRGRSR